MTEIKMKKFTPSFYVILIIIILAITAKFSSSENIKIFSLMLFCIFCLSYIIFDTYGHIRRKTYTTSKYIAIVNILNIFAFMTLCVFFLINHDNTSLEFMHRSSKYITAAKLTLFCLLIARSYIVGEKFKINKANEEK